MPLLVFFHWHMMVRLLLCKWGLRRRLFLFSYLTLCFRWFLDHLISLCTLLFLFLCLYLLFRHSVRNDESTPCDDNTRICFWVFFSSSWKPNIIVLELFCQLPRLYLQIFYGDICVLRISHRGYGQVNKLGNDFLQSIVVVLYFGSSIIKIRLLEWWFSLWEDWCFPSHCS